MKTSEKLLYATSTTNVKKLQLFDTHVITHRCNN